MISNLISALRQRLATCIETARIASELNDSSDRALADIGIARGDIGAVATGRFGRA